MKNKETIEEVKDLAYYRANAEEDYLAVPISVLRYISQLEQQERSYSEEDIKLAFIEGHNICRCVTDNTDEAKECFNLWFEQFKKK